MSRTTLTTVSLTVLVWTAMLSFGGVAAETVMLYPNVFGDPPESLDRAREFLVAGGPADYFPPLGATVVLSSLAATVLAWREPRLRWWVVGAAAVFIACEFLFSVLFFWPRTTSCSSTRSVRTRRSTSVRSPTSSSPGTGCASSAAR